MALVTKSVDVKINRVSARKILGEMFKTNPRCTTAILTGYNYIVHASFTGSRKCETAIKEALKIDRVIHRESGTVGKVEENDNIVK